MSRGADVLVVDDEAFIRLFAIDALDDAGFSVVAAANADEALVRLEENPDVAVLFTDINMPGGRDGLALAREVAHDHPEIQVIITSGRGLPHGNDMPSGSLFIAKPYNSVGLVKLVEAAVLARS